MLTYGSVKSEVQDLSLRKGDTFVGVAGVGERAPYRPRCNILPLPAQEGQVYCKPVREGEKRGGADLRWIREGLSEAPVCGVSQKESLCGPCDLCSQSLAEGHRPVASEALPILDQLCWTAD